MRQPRNARKTIAILGVMAVICVAATILLLGRNASSVYPVATGCPGDCPPVVIPTSIMLPTPPAFNIPITSGGELELIDTLLKQTIPASIAYNAPPEMQLGETITIELLLNPSISEPGLVREISEAGITTTATVEITPQMKVEILAPDEEAFTIRRIHDDPIQLVSSTETTRWAWFVTAKKEGTQQLTIVLYRLIKYEDRESWREVETYKSDIDIQVTLLGRLRSMGWGWIAGILVALALVPAFWRWMGVHKKQAEPTSAALRRGVPVREDLGHIFISYRRSDSADITGRIYDRLVDDFGEALIFKDVDSIPLGVDFKDYLDKKVGECRVLLAVIGDRWTNATDAAGRRRLDDPDDFVRIEIESALERDIPVIPLLVRGAQMPAEDSLPPSLQKLIYRNGIPIRPDPDFHRDMDRLESALKDHL